MTTASTDAALTQFHLRPSHGWLNDPNGVVHHGGRWHVFFQHNPEGPFHRRIAWGHASSEDLATWQEHRVAFAPQDGGPDEFGCWSGVFASGLERPAVVYSGLADDSLQSTVCLRWGSDDLMTWSDPVVVAETPQGAGVRVMRDPFLFQWAGRRWALLGAGLDDMTPAVLLYSCDDMLAWSYKGIFASWADPVLRDSAPADIWECPQLVWADGVPVLVLSLQLERKLDDVVAAVGGVEDVDGMPQFRGATAARIDEGASFYAPQLVQDGDWPLMFGWVREEDQRATGKPVAGCLTLPRRVSVVGGVVHTEVDPDAAQRILAATSGMVLGQGEHDLPAAAHLLDDGGDGVSLVGGGTVVAADLAAGSQVWLDADVAEAFPAGGAAPVTCRVAGGWRVQVPARAQVRVREVVPPTGG